MGLSCSHDAYEGGYMRFNALRWIVCAACGGKWPSSGSEDPYWTYDTDVVPAEYIPGMTLFLSHSDCDGHLTPLQCAKVFAFLEWAEDRVKAEADRMKAEGELRQDWSPEVWVRQFADGCRRAGLAGEILVFR